MIRKVKKDDYATIAKLLIKAFKNPPWNESWDCTRAYQRIEQLDDGKYTRCYVYLVNNKIVGVICGKLVTYVSDLELMIEDFYIDPDCQRMGIGRKMMKLLEMELPEVNNLTLLTGKNFYSVDFYKKNGFIRDDNIVLMRKKLGK